MLHTIFLEQSKCMPQNFKILIKVQMWMVSTEGKHGKALDIREETEVQIFIKR